MNKRISKYHELDDESGEMISDFRLEFPDPTPVEVPARFSRPPTLEERMKMFLRSERMKAAAEAAGMETFEEADDFEIDDEEELTEHELAAIMSAHAPSLHRSTGNPDVAPEGAPPKDEVSPAADPPVPEPAPAPKAAAKGK